MTSAHALLSRCLLYLNILDYLKIPTYSQLRYINTWSPNTIGYQIVSLLLLRPSSIPALSFRFFVSFISFFVNSYSCLADVDHLLVSNFNRVVVSWGKFKSSDLSVFVDPYTKLSSLDASILFLVFCEELPSSISFPSNVIVVFKSKILKSKPTKFSKVNLSKFKHKSLANVFCQLPISPTFSNVLIVFEPQPYINYLITFLKHRYPNVQTIGYIHSFLPSFPTEYIFSESSPHKVFINGDFQRHLLEKFLFWPKSHIYSVSSSRYIDSEIPHLPAPTIYLPYDFVISSFTTSSLHLPLSILHSLVDFSKLTPPIRNHPHASLSQKHINLISLLQSEISYIQKYRNSASYSLPFTSNKVSLVLGNSAVIFELLNSNIAVLHQASIPCFDLLDPILWPDILIHQVNQYISFYIPKSTMPLFDSSQLSFFELD